MRLASRVARLEAARGPKPETPRYDFSKLPTAHLRRISEAILNDRNLCDEDEAALEAVRLDPGESSE